MGAVMSCQRSSFLVPKVRAKELPPYKWTWVKLNTPMVAPAETLSRKRAACTGVEFGERLVM